MTARDRHPDWCGTGHRCRLGEHRSDPQTFTVPGAGSATVTRIRDARGREHAEVRLSIALPADPHAARLRLAALLTHLRNLIGPSPKRQKGIAA